MLANPPCPGCGDASAHPTVETIPDFALLQCTKCSLVFASPMRNPGGAWYDEAYKIRHFAIDDRVRDYYRWTVRQARALSTPAGPIRDVLDLGCGEGIFVAYARRCGFAAHGLDFSERAIATGRGLLGNEWIHVGGLERLAELGLPTAHDLITFFEVLEHLEDPAGFIALVSGHVRPGGFIALSVPNRDRWPVAEFNDYPPHHLTRWDVATLRSFLERSGFTVERIGVASALRSLNTFYCYLLRCLIYKAFGMHRKGLQKGLQVDPTGDRSPPAAAKPGAPSLARRLLSWSRPRQVRDALMWIPTVLTAPFAVWWFSGYTIMAIARRRA